MTRARQRYVAFALACACGVSGRAWADPPAAAPESRPVRKLGGEPDKQNEVAPAGKPAPALDTSDTAAKGREALQRARVEAREAVQDAREAVHDVRRGSNEAVEQARDAVQGARDQARDAMKSAREEARDAMKNAREQARDAMKDAREQARDAIANAPKEARADAEKAREQGREAFEQAKAAMAKAREQMQQALPGVPGNDARKSQSRYARRVAWHGLMGKVARPSDISPALRQELRHHALRTAKLQRIHVLATTKKDKATIERCDKLLVREEVRHKARMAKLLPEQPQPPAVNPAPAQAGEDDEPGEAEREDEEQEGEP